MYWKQIFLTLNLRMLFQGQLYVSNNYEALKNHFESKNSERKSHVIFLYVIFIYINNKILKHFPKNTDIGIFIFRRQFKLFMSS